MDHGNFGIFDGRLAKDKTERKNSDGSRVVYLTIAHQDEYVSGKGDNRKKQTEFPQFEAFIAKGVTSSPYDLVNKGDKISVDFSVKTYTVDSKTEFEEDGVTPKTEYRMSLVCDGIRFLESKTVTDARKAANAAKATDAPAFS